MNIGLRQHLQEQLSFGGKKTWIPIDFTIKSIETGSRFWECRQQLVFPQKINAFWAKPLF